MGTFSTGVAFNNNPAFPRGRYNTITDNMFNKFISEDPSLSCPIRLGSGEEGSILNTITNNHMAIAGDHTEPPPFAPEAGICGDRDKIPRNIVDNNFTH